MNATLYAERRAALRRLLPEGALLLLGASESPRNYAANTYPFRQDSSFAYFTGLYAPDLALLLEPDGSELLFGVPAHPDDVVWCGPQPELPDHARLAGIARTAPRDELATTLAKLRAQQVKLHFLPPYRADRVLELADWLGLPPVAVRASASAELVAAVVSLRSIKSDAEVAEIEEAIGVSQRMLASAFAAIQPGRRESEIAAALQAPALAAGRQQSFLPIVSIHGEVLHNTAADGVLKDGALLLLDSGTESPLGYASDITRTVPVAGYFRPQQAAIYQVVLDAQLAVIAAAGPTRTNRELHFVAARSIANGLTELGLMKGDVDEAVAAGAHALFFPHGIGHMLGLDVHDMEDLGDAVGYAPGESRSSQFGTKYLRLARKLEPGFVLTVEPGVYFIPALFERWRAQHLHEAFINYDVVEGYLRFGGIRIEDDLLITADGARVLGPAIPKSLAEIEHALAR